MATEDEALDYDWLRRQFIRALVSDEVLAAVLVLKGGNALALLHGIGERASLDLDFSMSEDVEDSNDLGRRMKDALERYLGGHGLRVFDWSFESRPREEGSNPRWGGYLGRFKLIHEAELRALDGDLNRARQHSIGVMPGGGASKSFSIDISRLEYCKASREKGIEDGRVRVYTLAAIAAEKLRAICQQMSNYAHQRHPAARARDFYDIQVVVQGGVDFGRPENRELVRAMFDVKDVPLGLLKEIKQTREFHREAWPRVTDALPADVDITFDECFEFVLRVVEELHPLWMENAP